MIEIGNRDNSDSTVPNPGVKELQTPGCPSEYILHGVASYLWVLSKETCFMSTFWRLHF